MRLIVANRFTVDGLVLADGEQGAVNAGSGAGGSIWIDADVITGSGTIQVNGGAGYFDDNGTTGAGAGGRLAIYAQTDNFSGNGSLQAYGGDDNSGNTAGAGTVYMNDGVSDGTLIVDNNSHNGQFAALLAGNYEFDAVQLTNNGHLEISGGLTITANMLQGDDSAWLSVLGPVTATAVSIFQNVNITAADTIEVAPGLTVYTITLAVPGQLIGADDVFINYGGELQLDAVSYPSGTLSLDEIDIVDGQLTLNSYANANTNYTDDYGFTLSAYTVTVGSAGAIAA
ncbi:MAG: hypothetical protein GY796_23095, partial [Chloroflexi bacterium]|nr:hypothetical protein [Chloroflexota bacterium]